MNFSFLRDVVGGCWHVNAQTYFELMPIRNLILTTGMQFEQAEPDASSLPYYIKAEDRYQYAFETAPESGELINVTVIDGVMTRQDQYCGGWGTQRRLSLMEEADRKRNVIGHILYINTGGGQTISLDPFKEVFADLQKPVVAFVQDMAASAGMGAATFAQEIYASKPKAVLGSIGTMIAFDGYPANSTSSDGLRHVRLYASKSVNKNGEFEKALNGDFKPLIENTLNPINEDFIGMVQGNRPAITDQYCDGQDYHAEDVVGTLIDGIQSFEATIDRVIQLAKQDNSSNNNSQNHTLMAQPTGLTFLSKVLGFSGIEVDKSGHVSLTEADATKLNNILQRSNTALSEAQANQTALTEAKQTIAERDKTIVDLQAQVAELGKEPGARTTTATPSSDDPNVDALLAFSTDSESTLEEMLNAFENYSE